VIGNHSTITMAGASSLFELNVAKPVLISNLLQSIDVLSHSVTIFTEKLLKDLDLDREKLQSNIDHSLLIATALNPLLGYDVVAQITRKAAAEGISPKAAALALGVISAGEYDAHVQPKMMALPK
jgi:fumarate hydratase class II